MPYPHGQLTNIPQLNSPILKHLGRGHETISLNGNFEITRDLRNRLSITWAILRQHEAYKASMTTFKQHAQLERLYCASDKAIFNYSDGGLAQHQPSARMDRL